MSKRKHPQIPSDHIRHTMEDLKLSQHELADVLKVSHSSVSDWINRNGTAPAWTVLACKGLRRAYNTEERMTKVGIYLVQVPDKHIDAFIPIARSLGIRITEIKL